MPDQIQDQMLADMSAGLAAGDPEAALDALKATVRSHPGDAALRLTLSQLQMVNGNWEKALEAADTAGTLDTEQTLLCQQWNLQIKAEEARAEVFAGKTTAFVMGDPLPWVAALQDALRLDAEGQHEAATKARRQAMDAAPALSGRIGETAFEWLCDADERIGPCFEAVVNGRYSWIPQTVVRSVTFQSPRELVDFVWAEAVVRLGNGGETTAMMPVRYPGSEASDDGRIRMARLTEFSTTAGGTNVGLGQRLFATNEADHPILDTRSIEFDQQGESA